MVRSFLIVAGGLVLLFIVVFIVYRVITPFLFDRDQDVDQPEEVADKILDGPTPQPNGETPTPTPATQPSPIPTTPPPTNQGVSIWIERIQVMEIASNGIWVGPIGSDQKSIFISANPAQFRVGNIIHVSGVLSGNNLVPNNIQIIN